MVKMTECEMVNRQFDPPSSTNVLTKKTPFLPQLDYWKTQHQSQDCREVEQSKLKKKVTETVQLNVLHLKTSHLWHYHYHPLLQTHRINNSKLKT